MDQTTRIDNDNTCIDVNGNSIGMKYGYFEKLFIATDVRFLFRYRFQLNRTKILRFPPLTLTTRPSG